jgi:hypothetical protein
MRGGARVGGECEREWGGECKWGGSGGGRV